MKKKFFMSGPPWFPNEISGAALLMGDSDPHKAKGILAHDPFYSDEELDSAREVVVSVIKMESEFHLLQSKCEQLEKLIVSIDETANSKIENDTMQMYLIRPRIKDLLSILGREK